MTYVLACLLCAGTAGDRGDPNAREWISSAGSDPAGGRVPIRRLMFMRVSSEEPPRPSREPMTAAAPSPADSGLVLLGGSPSRGLGH